MRLLLLLCALGALVACGSSEPSTSVAASPLQAFPGTLAYGPRLVGSQTTFEIMLSPAYGEVITVQSVALSGTGCGPYQVVGFEREICDSTTPCYREPPAPLPLQIIRDDDIEYISYLYIKVRFQPTQRGAFSCAAAITTNGFDPLVMLTGSGVAPVLNVTSAPSGFGNQRINTTSAPMALTVRNDGDTGQNLTVTSLTATSNPEDWVVSFDTSTPIAPGASRSGTVAFSPKATGAQPATLVIASNDPLSPSTTLSVTGTGTSAQVTAPGSVAIGSVVVNQSRTATLSVGNPGTHPLTITSHAITGANAPDFALVGATFPIVIAPGGSSGLTVQCRPAAVGGRTATLTLDTDADATPQDPAIALTCGGTKPDITVAPGSFGFGNVAPGTTATTTITVSNAGGANASVLSVGAPSLVGVNPGDFTVMPSTAFTVAPGASQNLTVSFTPSTFGARAATLRLSSDDQETPTVDVGLTGAGFGPEITLTTPAALGFGDVRLGDASGAQTISIRNDGNAGLVVSGATLIGTHPGDFALTGPALPSTVAGAGTLSWMVTCAPSAVGARTATLRIASNDTSEPSTDVALSCNGTVAPLTVTSPATPVGFGTVDVGASSTPVTITVRNNGTSTLTLATPVITPGAYAISTPLGTTSLAPSATTTLAVRFTPTVDGQVTGSLTIPYGAESLVVGLTGTGRAALVAASPAMVGFGSVVVGASATASVTLSNAGSAVTSVSAAPLSGADAGQFAVVTAVPTTVPANGNRALDVRCAPTSVGTKTATLTLDTDSDSNPQDPVVTLTCTGVKPDLSVDATMLAFGNVAPGTPAQRMLVVSNGTGATVSNLTVAAPAIAGANAADFSVSPAGAFSLAPGASRTLTVTFTPGGFGARAATLRLTSDDQETPTVDVALSGDGNTKELTIVAPTGPLAFGSVKLGAGSSPATIELRNDGNADLTIGGVLSTGTNASQFIVTGPATPAVIPGSASMTWTVQCRPTTTGAKSATLQITSDDADEGLRTFAMTCTGTQANLVMTTPASAPITFATTRVGESSPNVDVLLVNTGDAPLEITGPPAVSPPVFAVTTTFTQTPPFTVAPGGSASLRLRFTPTAEGQVDGSLQVNWDATSLVVSLRGTATVPVVGVTPAPDQGNTVDIGAVCVGQPRMQPFSVSNAGSGLLTVTDVTMTGAGFDLTRGTLPSPRGPGQTFDFTVTPAPTQAASVTGTITITTDAPGMTTRTVDVTARGLMSGLGIAPVGGITFGTVEPGAASPSTAITLTNCDTGTLTISSVGVTGPDRTEFDVVGGTQPPPSIVVPATQSAQWLVVYSPDDPGPSSATFHLVHDGTGGMTDVSLSGTGAGGPPADAGVDAPPDADTEAPDAGNPADGEPSSYYACAAGGTAGAGLATLLLLGLALAVSLRRRDTLRGRK